ncbi:hypothetical protein [Aureispira sp. CCB-QB1]|uniref:hypothetical protein n=1 Tax=Aureispira sp. CCB-QB1 TaxID=1313421 RepID=UPI0006991139|nr:hypothetical protein [Aureispira sp. CCB-QB1]
MDKITQRICASLFGTAAIIFAFAFLIRSASPAQANYEPKTTYGSTGKYMMQLSTTVEQNNEIFWHILAWDTETGRSKFYFGTAEDGTAAAAAAYNLPTNPL